MPDFQGEIRMRSDTVSRRSALRLMFAVGGASLLAACGPGAAPSPAPPPAQPTTGAAPAGATISAAKPAAATQAQIKKGGTLRWGQVGDIVTTDAFQWSPTANNTTGAVNETLIGYADDLTPMPLLAESWEQSSDLSKIKLNLRKGVTVPHRSRDHQRRHRIQPAARPRLPKNPFASQVAPGSNWWTSWEKPDKYTIILQSDKPRPGVFDFLQYLRILDKDTMEGPDAATKVVGTGSMMWNEWVPGDHITLVKNPNYWDVRSSLPGRHRDQDLPRRAGMVAALESGALDVADLIPIPGRRATQGRREVQDVRDARPRAVLLRHRQRRPGAHRQQNAAPGDQLRDRPQALRRQRPEGLQAASCARCRGPRPRPRSTPERTSRTRTTWTRRSRSSSSPA